MIIINDNINKYKKNDKTIIEFIPKEASLKSFLESLNSFGKINLDIYSFKFQESPKNINNNRIYTLSGENRNIITKTGKDGYMGTICEYELDKSIEEHKWKIKILMEMIIWEIVMLVTLRKKIKM